jgi:spore maturation protein CgeD
MVEDVPQTRLFHALRNTDVHRYSLPTPRDEWGVYEVIPYSLKINYALDRTRADYVTYLTDDSLPEPGKYEAMVKALDENPEWGAVYVGQRRNGSEHRAGGIVEDAFAKLDHTQVCHRLTADRWPLNPSFMRLGDAHFWRALHVSLGAFYPIPGPILDVVTQTPEGITATW